MKLDRHAPLPAAMQGERTIMDDPSSVLMIAGGEVTCFGKTVDYDHKLVESRDGALTVSLKIDDPAGEDSFQRANITGLVITPDGEFHAYSVKFTSQFVRATDERA